MVMQFMPLLEETKLELYTEFMGLTLPLLKDKTVITLMLLITVFDLESDERVKRINNVFLSILQRYLEEHTVNTVSSDMQNIVRCSSALPRLGRLLSELREDKDTALYSPGLAI